MAYEPCIHRKSNRLIAIGNAGGST